MRHYRRWLGIGLMLGWSVSGLAADEEARELLDVIKKDNLPRAKELIEANPGLINQKIPFNNFPLMMALESLTFNPEIICYLIGQGANVNARDEKGENAAFPLIRVSVINDKRFDAFKQVCQALCEKKVDFKQPNAKGETPLYILAGRQSGHYRIEWKYKQEMMRILLDHGASPKGQDQAPVPILIHIFSSDYFTREVDAALQNKDAAKQATYTRDMIDTIKFLLEKGAEVDAADPQGNTALLLAVKGIKVKDTVVLTPEQQQELVGILIEHGASPKKKNKAGESAQKLVDRKDPLDEILKRKPKK